MKQEIVIIGAGLAGLSLAVYLAKHASVTVYHEADILASTSRLAHLMHPLASRKPEWVWRGLEAYQESLSLLHAANPTCYSQPGLIKIDPEGELLPLVAAYPEWVERHALGIKINCYAQVQPELYLPALKKLAESFGARFVKKKVDSIEFFEKVIVATGADSLALTGVKVGRVKGQTMQMDWQGESRLSEALNGKKHAIQQPGENAIWVGGTYEHHFTSLEPDVSEAQKEILPKVAAFLPQILEKKIVSVEAGVRATLPGHLPQILTLRPGAFAVCGLGSKGLLYSALLAKDMVKNL